MTDMALRHSGTNPGRTYKFYNNSALPFGLWTALQELHCQILPFLSNISGQREFDIEINTND
jgi:hypothetical protein